MENINGFELVEPPILGGMSMVYEGRKGNLRKAFKLLRPDKVENNPKLSTMFLNEISVQSQLDHPNIVNIHNAYPYQMTDGKVVTVLEMEWLNGTNMQDLVDKKGPLATQFVRDVALQVCQGMQHAHEKGILHLDLKPSNIFRTANNLIKIIDFGIAKVVGDNAGIIDGSQSVTVISELGQTSFKGTPAYSAPEQQCGNNLTYASDIYAFGQTLHFLLTGTTDPAVEITDLKFRDIVDKCTRLNPNNRFRDFKELAIAIRGRKNRNNVHAGTATTPTNTPKPQPNNKKSISPTKVYYHVDKPVKPTPNEKRRPYKPKPTQASSLDIKSEAKEIFNGIGKFLIAGGGLGIVMLLRMCS